MTGDDRTASPVSNCQVREGAPSGAGPGCSPVRAASPWKVATPFAVCAARATLPAPDDKSAKIKSGASSLRVWRRMFMTYDLLLIAQAMPPRLLFVVTIRETCDDGM